MRKRMFSVLFGIFLLFCSSLTVYADEGNLTVHRTQTSSKYHSADCGHLCSDIPVILHDAVIIYN